MTGAAESGAPDFHELVQLFLRIGVLSFGGPAGQIALMHREIVEQRSWITEAQYLNALNFCHLLPGPEAQQLATWIGWKLHGVRGGVVAGLLFVLPGAFVMLGLSILYAFAVGFGWFAALFLGIKAAVLAIVAQALLRIAGRSLNTSFKKVLAAMAFVGLFVFGLPFPLVVLGAGAAGIAVACFRPDWLALNPSKDGSDEGLMPWRETVRAVAMWLPIWAVPMVIVGLFLGRDHVLWDIGLFFSQLAVVTFGGAYAVLAYMAQEAVQGFGWMTAGEMADGLGLAETTPGPLILVTQFVGFIAAFRAPAPFDPLIAGIIGALLTTWVTFAPCFLWIFALAPWIERLSSATRLKAALAAITAAVVGVIANLTLWFALHLLFPGTGASQAGGGQSLVPEWSSLDWRAAVLTALSLVLIFQSKWSVFRVLAVAGFGGLLLGLGPDLI